MYSQAAQTEVFIFNNGSDTACSTRIAAGNQESDLYGGWNNTMAILQQNAAAYAA